jgi:hypothetical protein
MAVKRYPIAALFAALLVGFASAQPPIDYTVTCDGEVLGAASLIDGELHVAIEEGVTCDGVLAVDGTELTVTFELDTEGTLVVTIDGVSGSAEQVPAVAIAGMVRARENRAAASENRGRGQETAAQHRTDGEEAVIEDAEDEDLLALAELPERPELPEVPERPELPAAAGGGRP